MPTNIDTKRSTKEEKISFPNLAAPNDANTNNVNNNQLEGKLAYLDTAEQEPHNVKMAAIVCHPHPLYGGTMDNKVAYILSRATLDCNIPVLRFNFRGVGNSDGTYAHGEGETDDTLAAVREMHRRYPNAKIILLGFSFGGGVAIRTALSPQLANKPALLITIAPSMGVFATPPAAGPTCPLLCVHSEDDDTVSYAQTINWAQLLPTPPKIHTFADAGHFFHGQLTDLRNTVNAFIGEHVSS